MVQGGADDHDVLPLVKLVRAAVDSSGMSLRAFATERRIAYSTLRYYYDKRRKPLSQPPRQETLRELALALEVPLGDVEQAALESLSYRAAPPRTRPRPAPDPLPTVSIEDLINADPSLHPVAKAHFINQLELLRLIPPDLQIMILEEQERRRQDALLEARGKRALEALPDPVPPKKPRRKG